MPACQQPRSPPINPNSRLFIAAFALSSVCMHCAAHEQEEWWEKGGELLLHMLFIHCRLHTHTSFCDFFSFAFNNIVVVTVQLFKSNTEKMELLWKQRWWWPASLSSEWMSSSASSSSSSSASSSSEWMSALRQKQCGPTVKLGHIGGNRGCSCCWTLTYPTLQYTVHTLHYTTQWLNEIALIFVWYLNDICTVFCIAVCRAKPCVEAQ